MLSAICLYCLFLLVLLFIFMFIFRASSVLSECFFNRMRAKKEKYICFSFSFYFSKIPACQRSDAVLRKKTVQTSTKRKNYRAMATTGSARHALLCWKTYLANSHFVFLRLFSIYVIVRCKKMFIVRKKEKYMFT